MSVKSMYLGVTAVFSVMKCMNNTGDRILC